MLKESAAPTAAKGTMVALQRAAMRTNSPFSGQNRRYSSLLVLQGLSERIDIHLQI